MGLNRREKAQDLGKVMVGDGLAPVKTKKQGARLTCCESAQDLRCLDMEKEKNDEASPRGVLEACMRSLDSQNNTPKNNQPQATYFSSKPHSIWGNLFKKWRNKSVKRLPSINPLQKMSGRNSRSTRENPILKELCKFKSTLATFTFSDLKAATNNFSQENIIGRGGYALVYKGRLRDGQHVAVKRLTKGTQDEITTGFLNELGIIAHVDHPNTAKFIGCCIEGGMLLVFELSRLGSLGSLLHGSKSKLDWSKRYKIALGIAHGLQYLHESCHRRIIHRDIKADNILLTEDYEPQICDFGLAKWLPKQWTHYNVSKFEGTFGYFAPEYFMHGIVDEKTDIFAFGVLLLELITGRQAVDNSQQSLVLWAKPLLEDRDIQALVDPTFGDDYNSREIDRVVSTASSCVEQSPILRPRMSQAVILLRGGGDASEWEKESQKRTLQRAYSEELLDAREYNSTKYLSDLHRHRELALGS